MKNFTKTLAAAAIIIFASGTESAFANSLTSEDTAAHLLRVESTSDIAMPRYIADKSFDVEIHEIAANDKADTAFNFDNLFK